jgi:hypothetical protein
MIEEDLAWFIYNEVSPDEVNERDFRHAYNLANEVGHTKHFISNPIATDCVACARKLLKLYQLAPR